jgi:hypothetical protein
MKMLAALGAALCLSSSLLAHADCSKLDGKYRFESAATSESERVDLSVLTVGPERRKLFRYEGGSTGGGLSSTQPRTRPKVTALATSATLTYAPKNTRLRFIDAEGKVLAELPIDAPDPWACVGNRLERRFERMGGLGNAIRTERIEEVLERNAAGNLVHRETTTIIEGGRGTRKKENVYAAVR